jgi:hypothetical protein
MTEKRKKRLGLNKSSVKNGARECVDFDYLDKLTSEELDFLDKFCREEYNNDLTHEQPLNRPPFNRLYNQHNARNRDIWNQGQRVEFDVSLLDGVGLVPKSWSKDERKEFLKEQGERNESSDPATRRRRPAEGKRKPTND